MSRDEVIKNVMLKRQPSKEFATVQQIGGGRRYFYVPMLRPRSPEQP